MTEWRKIVIYNMDEEFVKKLLENFINNGYVKDIKSNQNSKTVEINVRIDMLAFVKELLRHADGMNIGTVYSGE